MAQIQTEVTPTMLTQLIYLSGLGFPFLMTTLGSATVLCFRRPLGDLVQRCLMGFAAGVMTAASVWSLLLPAIEGSAALGLPGWLPAGGGFVLGALFLLGLDRVIPWLQRRLSGLGGRGRDSASVSDPPGQGGCQLSSTALLVLAVTIHNIPEGMAVGLCFALAAQQGMEPGLLAGAAALSLGIGVQNFPEGAAVSLPLRGEGMGKGRAFLMGALSGAVEPVCGALAVVWAGFLTPVMPWLLAFAAGSMLYVVAEELIPQANRSPNRGVGTLGVMAGFLVMMVLDVAMG